MLHIQPQRLTRKAFAPFGDVIEIEGSSSSRLTRATRRVFMI